MSKNNFKSELRGLPLDSKDIQNLKNAIDIYEKKNPPGKVHTLDYDGKKYIEYCNIGDHLQYIKSTIKSQVGFKNLKSKSFDIPIKLKLSIPPSLEQWLNKGYPTLFTDEKQTESFLKNFPEFDLRNV